MSAATALIAERGIAATTLDDVRERAHASKSQLYLYFSDRDELLRAVASATCEEVLATQSGALERFDTIAGIERYLDEVVALQVERDAPGCPIGSLASQLAGSDEPSRLRLADGLDRWEHSLRAGLETMAGRGELSPDADPAALAAQAITLIQGGLLLSQVHRDPARMRAAADAILELIVAATPGASPHAG